MEKHYDIKIRIPIEYGSVVNNYGPAPLINAVALKVKGVALHTCACPVFSISFRIAVKLTKLGSKLIIFLIL